MPRTRVQRVGQESVSLQALGLLCSSGKGLMESRVMCTGEANYFRDYKRLGAIAKLATSYLGNAPMRTKPAAQQRPKAFHGIYMDFTQTVAIFIACEFASSVVDTLMVVAP